MNAHTSLVVGATGRTGRRVAARLRLRGVPVRAASRSSRVHFDWSQPSGWDAVLRDIDAAYVVPPPVPGPVHAFVERAVAAGVRRLVLLSGRGADGWGDSGFGRNMVSAEEAVRGAPLEWTVLRASNFAQNFGEDVFHAPLLAGELALPAGDVPEPFVDVEDIADAAVTTLTERDRHVGQVYELSGPRPVRFTEAVELIARASGRTLTYRQITPDAYVAALVGQGVGRHEADEIAEMFALIAGGSVAGATGDLATVLGRAPRIFEEYVVRAAAAGVWDPR
ncbi:NAD(P)H-binding protein [Streptomyces sp. NPDC058382]|uniref:NmrA family NAD(P)-binding protein n=1 Tax=unclassified Streptomyces TaxID=2593676 RepID=UPI00362A0F3E